MTADEKKKKYSRLKSDYVQKAEYGRAIIVGIRWIIHSGFEPYAVGSLGTIIADYGSTRSIKLTRIFTLVGLAMIQLSLLQRKRLSDRELEVMINEYFWFTKQPRKQFQNGLRYVRKGDRGAHYGMGVGASRLSLDLLDEGKKNEAAKWAKKSIQAWHKYFEYYDKYYNSYVHYARAHIALDDREGMDRALKKAQELSSKPQDYVEFSETRLLWDFSHGKDRGKVKLNYR